MHLLQTHALQLILVLSSHLIATQHSAALTKPTAIHLPSLLDPCRKVGWVRLFTDRRRLTSHNNINSAIPATKQLLHQIQCQNR